MHLFFYIIPALFTAVEGINANNVNSFTMFLVLARGFIFVSF